MSKIRWRVIALDSKAEEFLKTKDENSMTFKKLNQVRKFIKLFNSAYVFGKFGFKQIEID